MAPRIQVYNHIACQAFKKLPGSLPLPSPSNLTATIFAPAQDEDCPSADIQPRAAQIQASELLPRIKSMKNRSQCSVSHHHVDECAERNNDRSVEPLWRYSRAEDYSLQHNFRFHCHVSAQPCSPWTMIDSDMRQGHHRPSSHGHGVFFQPVWRAIHRARPDHRWLTWRSVCVQRCCTCVSHFVYGPF